MDFANCGAYIFFYAQNIVFALTKWLVKGQEYHITHVYNNIQQNGIKGVELFEHDISECVPYNCYRLGRFAFTEDNLNKLIEMMQDCTELNNVDISSIVEKLT